jgi:hypothetical protein
MLLLIQGSLLTSGLTLILNRDLTLLPILVATIMKTIRIYIFPLVFLVLYI